MEQADAHIDDKIDRNVHRIVQAGAVEVIVKEKIQGLQNEHIPHNQGKYKAKASSENTCAFLYNKTKTGCCLAHDIMDDRNAPDIALFFILAAQRSEKDDCTCHIRKAVGDMHCTEQKGERTAD